MPHLCRMAMISGGDGNILCWNVAIAHFLGKSGYYLFFSTPTASPAARVQSARGACLWLCLLQVAPRLSTTSMVAPSGRCRVAAALGRRGGRVGFSLRPQSALFPAYVVALCPWP